MRRVMGIPALLAALASGCAMRGPYVTVVGSAPTPRGTSRALADVDATSEALDHVPVGTYLRITSVTGVRTEGVYKGRAGGRVRILCEADSDARSDWRHETLFPLADVAVVETAPKRFTWLEWAVGGFLAGTLVPVLALLA